MTGAAGFIGSHLVDAYLERGAHVIGVDNLLTGSKANLNAAKSSDRFAFVRADVSDEWPLVDQFVGEAGLTPDRVLHLASPASPIDYAKLPLETLAVNSRGTEAALRAAERWRARFLFASTSEAYGDPLEHPQTETYWGNVNPIGPRSCYDEAKRFGEALVTAHIRTTNVDARIIRIFNTYGPRMRRDDGRVVANFVSQALAGKPLTVYGSGSQTRSFCYVSDLVRGIVACAESEAARDEVINLGNPDEYTIRQFAEIVARLVGIELRVEAQPMPTDDPSRRRPDIAKAERLLGWTPEVSVSEGILQTIEAFRQAAQPTQAVRVV
ncbi:MAG: GDP-mannose 4,6-dehydratase [Candidatus Baltobacteraceae bacterium]